MDIWGTGSFENSAAQDFLLELGEDGSVALREALEVVTDPDTEFVAPEEGARALAAGCPSRPERREQQLTARSEGCAAPRPNRRRSERPGVRGPRAAPKR